jgi:hypothetical protein
LAVQGFTTQWGQIAPDVGMLDRSVVFGVILQASNFTGKPEVRRR